MVWREPTAPDLFLPNFSEQGLPRILKFISLGKHSDHGKFTLLPLTNTYSLTGTSFRGGMAIPRYDLDYSYANLF